MFKPRLDGRAAGVRNPKWVALEEDRERRSSTSKAQISCRAVHMIRASIEEITALDSRLDL